MVYMDIYRGRDSYISIYTRERERERGIYDDKFVHAIMKAEKSHNAVCKLETQVNCSVIQSESKGLRIR